MCMCALRGDYFVRTAPYRGTLAPRKRLTQITKESGNLKAKTKALEEQFETTERQLEQEQHRLYRLQNRASYLKKVQRKQRNHRLITLGAMVESIEPKVKELSPKEFYFLAERIFLLDSVQELVADAVDDRLDPEDGD